MESLFSFGIIEAYNDLVAKSGDPLAKILNAIDWEMFRPILESLYTNKDGEGGHPNFDVILMLKIQVLESWYGLSDPEAEREIHNRLSFMHFLGFPNVLPDKKTIWDFRERIKNHNCSERIWDELQRQINEAGFTVHTGIMQDASFIEADPGHKPVNAPRQEQAKTRRSRDGTWAVKNNKAHFGFKMHTQVDQDFQIIRNVVTTTASLHDSQVDLSEPETVIYRDRGYQGAACKGYNGTMKRGARNHPIDIRDKLRNIRISRKRSPVERPYAVIKRIFKGGRVFVTTIPRVKVKNMFSCFCYNLLQMNTLRNKQATE